VQEQSHKSEMGAALRGDFERLRARRNGGVMTAAESVIAEAGVEPAPPAVEEPAEAAAGDGRPSWLDRLRDRF
jgi:hypothetical protein